MVRNSLHLTLAIRLLPLDPRQPPRHHCNPAIIPPAIPANRLPQTPPHHHEPTPPPQQSLRHLSLHLLRRLPPPNPIPTLTALSVTLSLATDSILFHRARHEPIGYYSRRINILFSVVAGALVLYLSYAARNSENTLHLSLIGLHSLAVLAVKTSNLAKDRSLRLAYPALRTDPVAHTIRWWKEATVWFALPMAILLNMGTYTCRSSSPLDKQTPGTACYRVLAIAAPADWLYAFITVHWSLHMGFEVSQDGHISMVVARSRKVVMGMDERSEGEDGGEYEALTATGNGIRGTLWNSEHPDIDLEDVPAAVVNEVA